MSAMKKIRMFILFSTLATVLHAQQTFVINSAGLTFNPSDVIVNQGDIVRFNLSPFHPVAQVSQSTWNSNGNTLLPGGFSFPSGTGDYTAVNPGTFYFVCTSHASSGMKGTIVVNATTGFEDPGVNIGEKLFPNPATDFLIYQTGSNSPVDEIRILDITGKAVTILHGLEFSDNQIRINTAKLNKGIYFIKVKSDAGTSVRKFIKS